LRVFGCDGECYGGTAGKCFCWKRGAVVERRVPSQGPAHYASEGIGTEPTLDNVSQHKRRRRRTL
jgi:hypothetical protein